MQAVTLFSLAKHAGEYKDWPLKTPLLLNSQSTSLAIPGFQLLHQFKLQSGDYLLITDWDCPFEEATEFLLISNDFKISARKTLGAPYAGFLLDTVEILNSNQLKVTIFENDYFLLTIKPPNLLTRATSLSLKRI